MKILHVLSSPRAEGTPRLVLDWLTVEEHEQAVLFLSDRGELKNEFDRLANWKYYNTSFDPSFRNIGNIIRLVYTVCLKKRPDVVIAWMTGFSPWVHLGARFAGVRKLIAHAGNPPGNTFITKYIFSYMAFWIGRLLNNKVITCSGYIRNQFTRIPLLSKNQFYTVYNCFQPDKFLSVEEPHARNHAIMVATMENHKDHATLLRAWQLLETIGLQCMLQLVGDGRLKNELIQLGDSLGLKNLKFLGSRTDIPHLLQKSKLFILSTTRQEGFGTVLIEALAAGCQVIASDVPACREVLQDGRYGILVSPGDASKLADVISASYNSELAESDRLAQMAYATDFSPKEMMEKYFMVFENEN